MQAKGHFERIVVPVVRIDVTPFTAILALKKLPVNTPVVDVVDVADQRPQW